MSQDIILETRDLTKEFKGFVAVSGVNLKVRRGTIHALIGPNGAGKTTVFNLLTKFLSPTRGSILFKGKDITWISRPRWRAGNGPLVSDFRISPPDGAGECGWPATPLADILPVLAVERSLDALTSSHGVAGTSGLGHFASTIAVNSPYGRKRTLDYTTLALGRNCCCWTSRPPAWAMKTWTVTN